MFFSLFPAAGRPSCRGNHKKPEKNPGAYYHILYICDILPLISGFSPQVQEGQHMRCPYCGYKESKVVDSRPADESSSIRRRRECLSLSLIHI